MKAIKTIKLAHSVQEELVGAIERGEFPPGSRLPSERELMARLGVGRPAIREAMQSLERMGLVQISHGARAKVMAPAASAIIDQISDAMIQMINVNPQSLDELKDARILMETGLARVAAERATDESLARLKLAYEACIATQHDHPRFVEADMAFHVEIATMSGNPIIAAASRGLLTWMTRFRRNLIVAPGVEHLTLQEHLEIYEAIAARNPDAAAAALLRHLRRDNLDYGNLRWPESVAV